MAVDVTGSISIMSSWNRNFASTPKWANGGGGHHQYRNGIHG
jgi:hypothetical protein